MEVNISQFMHRTIEDLNATWWYRLLKVIFIILFVSNLLLWGAVLWDAVGVLLWLSIIIGIALLFWLISRIFFYIVLGEFLPRR